MPVPLSILTVPSAVVAMVPWDALATGYHSPVRSTARLLTLTHARPELVRRRGLVLSRRRIGVDSVNAGFAGHAIAIYVANPSHRAAIGTQAEYDNLLRTFSAPAC